MMSSWEGKTVVVTGASAGLGLAIAEAFAQRKANLALLARGEDALRQAATNLQKHGSSVAVFPTDLTQDAEVEQAFRQIRTQFPSIDVLVNAAGRSARQAVLDTTPDDFQKLWELNFLALVRCVREAAADLTETQGHIVNIGSLASKIASRYLGAYPVTKFAAAAYTHQLRLELGPKGVHVLLVCPGPIKRDDAGRRYEVAASGLPPVAREPGGGARIRSIEAPGLARRIIQCCEQRRLELVVPSSARWLFAISQLWPSLGDWILSKKTARVDD